MDYAKHYELLIEKANKRKLDANTYTEKHHITPKCLGGTNDKSNIVCLLPEEHYIAHQLLCKMHPYHHGLSYALYKMTLSTKHTKRTNKCYKWVKSKLQEANRNNAIKRWEDNVNERLVYSERSKLQWKNKTKEEKELHKKRASNRQKGESNTFYGKTHTDETKQRLSQYRKNLYENMTHEDKVNHPQTKLVSANGTVYASLSDAARDNGIGPSLAVYRCKSNSKKWKDWFYVKKVK